MRCAAEGLAWHIRPWGAHGRAATARAGPAGRNGGRRVHAHCSGRLWLRHRRHLELACAQPRRSALALDRGLVVHRRERSTADGSARSAGHGTRMDGDRSGSWPAAASRTGHAGCRAAQPDMQPRRAGAGHRTPAPVVVASSRPRFASPGFAAGRVADGERGPAGHARRGPTAASLQYELIDLTGRLWRLDFAWPEFGWLPSTTVSTGTAGPRRSAGTASGLGTAGPGWVVVPIIAEDVRYQPAQLVRRLNARLSRAA